MATKTPEKKTTSSPMPAHKAMAQGTATAAAQSAVVKNTPPTKW